MSLIHYWPLDEESGSIAADVIGSLDASVVNDGSTIVPGLSGNARDFSLGTDGNKSHLVLYNGAAQADALSEWSLSCWVKQGAEHGGGNKILWFFFDDWYWTNGVYVAVNGQLSEMQVDLYGPSGWIGQLFTSNIDFTDGEWHHIVIRCDGSSTDLIIDSTSADTINQAAPLLLKSNHSYFGSEEESSSWLDMAADELAVFDHALSNEEVEDLYNISEDGPDEPIDFIPPERPTRIYYAAELRKSDDTLRLPISSWQATLQTGRQSYLQCVVPAAEQYIDAITDLGLGSTLTVIRGALLPDGETTELDMATVPLQQMPYQRGPQRSTVTLSGYGSIEFDVVDAEAPPEGSVRTLTGVQTISVDQGGNRARAEIDWLLRPGLIADADGSQFQVAYINYYASRAQEFMDVGSRAL